MESSSQAMVTAVGRPFATSAANVGTGQDRLGRARQSGPYRLGHQGAGVFLDTLGTNHRRHAAGPIRCHRLADAA